MSPAQIFTVQKNEKLAEDWIIYHGDIFGFDNIHFIDNNSSIEQLKVLSYFEKYYNLNVYTLDDFALKAHKLTEIMNLHKHKSKFLIPLDGDEFLCSKRIDTEDVNIIFDKTTILTELEHLSIEHKLKINILLGHPTKNEYDDILSELHKFTIFDDNLPGKRFYPSTKFISTDQGNHYGKIDGDNSIVTATNITMLHYHYQGYKHLVSKTAKFKEGYHNWENTTHGIHMIDRVQQLEHGTLKHIYNAFTTNNIYSADTINVNFSEQLKTVREQYT